MKTTLDIPTDLYRQAKIGAATEGCRIKDLVSEGLAAILAQPRARARARRPASAYDLMRDACGCVDSGVTDLATHPRHMEGFGRE